MHLFCKCTVEELRCIITQEQPCTNLLPMFPLLLILHHWLNDSHYSIKANVWETV